ncbi:MAG: alpha-L-fucosidase precursor, partial [Rhodopirellula sp. JB053]
MTINRRNVLHSSIAAATALCGPRVFAKEAAALNDFAASSVPSYLQDVAKQYADNPRHAALDWFRGAEFGLFL